MNNGILRSFLRNANSDEMAGMLQDLPTEDLARELAPVIEEEVIPHLDDIMYRSRDEDADEARAYYENLPDEEQQEAFDKAIADLAVVLRECREQPATGFPKLKARLRDPDVIEPILLIFDNPEYIDPEYTDDLKEFAVDNVRWMAMQVLPEIYTEDEREEILAKFTGESGADRANN